MSGLPERLTGYTDLVCREKKDIRTRRVHLVTLARMNGFLLNCLDLEWFKFLVEDLTQIHHNAFVDLGRDIRTKLQWHITERRTFLP
jgi:hypothetical protein